MLQIVILGVAFFCVALLVVSAYAWLDRRRLATEQLTRSRLLGDSRAQAQEISIFRDDRASDVGFLDRLLSGKGITGWMSRELTRAGSKRKPAEIFLTAAVSGVLVTLAGQRFLTPGLAIVLGVAAAATPFVLVKRRQGKRVERFEELLPDAIDMLVNALRAGYSLQAAMEFVGKEMPDPLGPEFARFYEEQRLGIDVRRALTDMQDRVDSSDFRMFVTSLLVQRETGGNLGEVLGNIGALMRERVAFRGHVDGLMAEPKMSANVLGSLPFFVAGIIMLMNPTYLTPLFTTPTGTVMAVYAICSVAVGYFVMRKIAQVDF